MSRHSKRGARANQPGNGPAGGGHAIPADNPESSGGLAADATPEASDAIRVRLADDEPPALVFHDLAAPAALVSWAWCQLTALDALLRATLQRQSAGDDDVDVAGAVRTVLVPVINALAFSERRAHALQCEREAQAASRARPRRGARKARRGAD